MFEGLQVIPLQRACYSTHASTKQNIIGGDQQHGVMSNKVWGFPATGGPIQITYDFLLGSDAQKGAVTAAMAKWQRYANVVFKEFKEQPNARADLRIAFKRGDGSWSLVGRQAILVNLEANTATMNLGWLPTFESQQTAEDMGTVLHELGHALGLLHEHQSPARGGTINLKLDAVYTHYTPLLQNDRNLVLTQVINQYNSDAVEAFSRLDLKSIMMYPMEMRLNEENIDVPYNTDLSEIDKAFIMLTYPGRKDADLDMSLEKALQIATVPAIGVKEIQDLVAAEKFTEARAKFFFYNKEAMASYRVNKQVLHSIDQIIGPSHGIFNKLGDVVQHPVFKDVLGVIVHKVLVKHGIPSNTKVYNPDMNGEDVLGGVRSLLMNPELQRAVEVQKASGIIGDVYKILVDVGKLMGKIPAFLRKRAAQAEVDLLKQPSWMRCTLKNATEFSIVTLESHFEQGAYHVPPGNIESLAEFTFSGYNAKKKEGVLAGTAFRVYFISKGNKYFDFALGWKKSHNGSYEVGIAASHDPKEGYNKANKMGGRLETDIFQAQNTKGENFSFRLLITVAASQTALCVVKEVIWQEGDQQPVDDPKEEAPGVLTIHETIHEAFVVSV